MKLMFSVPALLILFPMSVSAQKQIPHSVSDQDTLLTAYTEAPELLEKAGTSFALSEEEYRKIADRLANWPNFVAMKEKPKQLTRNARFGLNLSYGGLNRSWILDGDEKQGYVLYADLNANGNLADDSPLRFERREGKHTILVETSATEKVGENDQNYPVNMKIEITRTTQPGKTEPKLALNLYSRTRRKGILHADGNSIRFTLTGAQGIYNSEHDLVSFDLNNDGELGPSESYAVREKQVNIGNHTFEFEVDRYGRTLRLKRRLEYVPSRPSLQVGTQAPEFMFTDIDRRVHRLSDFLGKVVLLDFWGIWCGPCVVEAPRLAATFHRLHERGFEIIGFHLGEDTASVRKFIAEKKMNWTHAIEGENGTIHKLFRVEGWPTYYLIDKSGNILSNSLRPGESLTKEIQKQFQGN